jgi:hypothetical protein
MTQYRLGYIYAISQIKYLPSHPAAILDRFNKPNATQNGGVVYYMCT